MKKDAGHSFYPALKVTNDIVSEDHEEAQVFNDFFLEHSRINDGQAPLPGATCHADYRLSTILIRKKDIEDLLTSLDITKATGPGQICQVKWKKAEDIVVPSLTRLFNFNYRPVSLFMQTR